MKAVNEALTGPEIPLGFRTIDHIPPSHNRPFSGGQLASPPARPHARPVTGPEKEIDIAKAVEAKKKCEPLIDAHQAADLLEIHPKTVKRLAARGTLPGMRIGRLWRFRASLLDAWLKSRLDLSGHPCPDTKGEG